MRWEEGGEEEDDDDDDDIVVDDDVDEQVQWLTLQLCLVTVGVTECSRLNRLF